MAADIMRGEQGNGKLDDDTRHDLARVGRALSDRFPFGARAKDVRGVQERIGTFGADTDDALGSERAVAGGTRTGRSPETIAGATLDELVHAGDAANAAYRLDTIDDRTRERDAEAERRMERNRQMGRDRDYGAER